MPALAAALEEVAAALRGARDPWWVIGSAAARLHGAQTMVSDVDVLLSRDDALALIAGWRRGVAWGEASERFRSAPFARLDGMTLPIELMAGLQVNHHGRWRPVQFRTRAMRGGVYVPDRAELLATFALFGRAKDIERAGLLRAAVEHGGVQTDAAFIDRAV